MLFQDVKEIHLIPSFRSSDTDQCRNEGGAESVVIEQLSSGIDPSSPRDQTGETCDGKGKRGYRKVGSLAKESLVRVKRRQLKKALHMKSPTGHHETHFSLSLCSGSIPLPLTLLPFPLPLSLHFSSPTLKSGPMMD